MSELRETRLEKARALQALGHPPYALSYAPSHRTAELQQAHAELADGAELDEQVAAVGGRLYLAKDSRQSAAMFQRTYPRLQEWQQARRQLDPRGVFSSDLARRVGID